jgi:hypothetical protein
MGLWKKISAWWSQDDVKDAAEAVRDDSQASETLPRRTTKGARTTSI